VLGLPDPYLSKHVFWGYFEEKIDKNVNEAVAIFENFFSKVIRFEYEHLGDDFELKGIAERFQHYTTGSILYSISQKCRAEISSYIENNLTEFDSMQDFLETMQQDPEFSIFVFDTLVNHKDEFNIDSSFINRVSKGIKAYKHYKIFSESKYSTDSDIPCSEWIIGDTKDRFLKYLIDLSDDKDIDLGNSNPSSDRNIRKFEIPGIINFIEKAILI
jgi:hypothetical protein